MMVEFTKMNGAGNDFILIDNRDQKLKLSRDQVKRLCHRQRGIGADGLFLLIPCKSGKADWAWEFYNSDGSKAEMCGNGARCFARFIARKTGAKDRTSFETAAGIISASLDGNRVTVNLTQPKDLQLNQVLPLRSGKLHLHSVNTGVPHAVTFVPDADKAMVQQLGAEIRNHEHFAPNGTNVNFVQVLVDDPGSIRVRTYERGVEGETLACGTGVTASALISASILGFNSPVKVQVQGGDILEVSFTRRKRLAVLDPKRPGSVSAAEFSGVKLTGPADFCFDGKIEI